KSSNLLPWLLVIVAIFWSWQLNVLGHETCDNEKRYENQVMCEGKQFGCLVPYPDNCSLFLVCDCLYPTVKLCPANLWWDNKTQLCNYPQAVECIFYSIDTPEPTDGTTRITPAPTLSTEKIATESTTPSWPKTTEGILTTPSVGYPTSSWDPPPAPPGIPEDFCAKWKDGSVHRYPYDCQAYINCTHGWPVLNYCDKDKAFNELLLICDTPDAANCVEISLPTTTTESKPTSTTEMPATSTTEGEVVCGPGPEFIDDDFCQPKGNGFYEYPYNCSGYLACRNGCTDLDFCQPDKLFNSFLHICDTPDSVYCDTIPYPTTPGSTVEPTTTTTPLSTTPATPSPTTPGVITTTEVSTSTTVEITTPGLPADVDPNVCKGYSDDMRFPYIGNCSQYIYCKNNQAEMGECAALLLFNPDYLICDDPNDVECIGDRTTTPIPTTKPTTTTERTTTTTTTTTQATTLGPAELCEGQEVGTSFPYPEDCGQYYLCLGNGNWYLAPCIYGSYFDPKTGNCGPNVSPNACKETETTTTTTPATTTTEKVTTTTKAPPTTQGTTTTEVPSTGICAGRYDNENIAYPKDCNKYIVCVSPIPIAFYCPSDTFFSSKQQKCIESWEESDCEGEQGTTTPEPGYTRPPPEPTMCTNSSRDTFPYPENCQWFIRCVDDYIYMMDVCNCGEYYDPITEKCGPDVPSDACRWDYSSTTSTSTTSAPTTTEEPTTIAPVTRPPPQKGPCDDAEDGALVPYPNDCSKYIQCDRPIAVAFDCDEGDEFSVELGKCVDAALANCSITTTAKPSESTTPTTEADSSSSSTALTTESTTTFSTQSTSESTTQSTPDTSTKSTTESPVESTTASSTVSATESTTQSPTTLEPESSSTEPGTTPTISTTTLKPSGGICDGKTDDSLVPYPNNCGKYIMCQYPIPVGYDCPIGLEFSPTELTCMDPDVAGCSPQITTPGVPTSTQSSTPKTTTTEPTTVSTTPKTTTIESTTAKPTTDSTTKSTTAEPTTVSTTPKTTTPEPTTVSTTPKTTTTEPTTVSTTPKTTTTESTTPKTTTTEPTTVSTTPKTTTTESTTTVPTTASTTPKTTTTESSTESTTPRTTTTESTTVSTTTELSTTTAAPPITLDPYTPNICCGQPLGTLLAYPNDCSRYVVCDYPIPYAVDCDAGTVFDDKLLQCTATPIERCLYNKY
ncbi:hypothetical protein KR009_001228, partial [Drosophila setifemur]